MKTKLVFFLSAGDSRGQKVSGGGGSGFCGTVKRDVTCSKLFLLPEAWCHIHSGWVFLAYLPTCQGGCMEREVNSALFWEGGIGVILVVIGMHVLSWW